jgi:hypothetical protein
VFTLATIILFWRLARIKAYSAWQDAKKKFIAQMAGTFAV